MTPTTVAPTTPLVERTIADERVLVLTGLVLVASRSEAGTWHRIQDDRCDCPGFTYRGRCRHLAVAAEATQLPRPVPNGTPSPEPEPVPVRGFVPTCRRCQQPRTLLHGTGTCAVCLATAPAD